VEDPVFDYDEIFGEDYLYFYGEHLEAVADDNAAAIWRLLELEPGSAVLDLACGHGRIANRLAERGAQVTGLDRSPGFLDQARADARARGVTPNLVQGDMRSLPWPDATFDHVVSWFSSFGYFGDDENRTVLAEAHRVLRPGGRLLLENNNLVEVLPRWAQASVLERDGDLAVDRAVFDPTTGRATTERLTIRGGEIRRATFSVRMFVAAELGDWLRAAGFRAVRFTDHAGDPLTAGSRRMVTIATR
jgi:ubiquinone/menaquinone biosynthesis C-methylase UbiE